MPVFVLGIKAPLSVVTKLLCKELVPQQIREAAILLLPRVENVQGFSVLFFQYWVRFSQRPYRLQGKRMNAPTPVQEAQRMDALRQYAVLDTPPEQLH